MEVYYYYCSNFRVKMATRVHGERIVIRTRCCSVASDHQCIYINSILCSRRGCEYSTRFIIIIILFFYFFLIPATAKNNTIPFYYFPFPSVVKAWQLIFSFLFSPSRAVASAHTVFHMALVREQFIRQTPPRNNGISLKMLGDSGGVAETRKNKTKSDHIVGRCSYILL